MFEYIWYELLQDVYSCTNRGDDYKSYVFTQYLNFYLNYDLLVQYKIWQSDLIQKKKKHWGYQWPQNNQVGKLYN